MSPEVNARQPAGLNTSAGQLAQAWGRAGDETAGWMTWFEMDHP